MVDFINKMKEYKGRTIIVVMEDGRALKGKLEDVGTDLIVLKEVHETDNVEINWKSIGTRKEGFARWIRVNLPEVTIRIEGILRVWPYELLQENAGEKEERTVEKKGFGPIVRGEYTLIGDL